ncbi:Alpha/Beta hydrolase protein [Phlyctochytrium arcticum]|nr:Alpha/Beta hydrolase protein [Phlyctochytrium arcticum]
MLSHIPVLGRLGLLDYLRLFLAVTILVTEPIFRFIFAIFWPLRYIVDGIRRVLRRGRDEEKSGKEIPAEKVFQQLNSTEQFARFWGFPFQHHYVTSKDGYILALHRIPSSRAEHDAKKREKALARRSNSSTTTPRRTAAHGTKPVVVLWHGFLMSSEVWVCHPDRTRSLAFTLADAGYDVWLGNTRGNKYSCKHRSLKPTEETFWDFSMDHLALYDLPDAVDYIIKVTGAPSLTYIGFSQGTAQGFSALSINARLNKRINLFIALAPAAKPMGLENKTLGTMLNISPEVVFLLFGKKSLLSMTLFWQSILTPLSFAWMIDVACKFLFKWNAEMIDHKGKVYQHLYSYTSVKCVVHWFQIIRNGRFQMYDESPTVLPNSQSGHVVPKFPTEHIQTPIALFYGGKDTLADMDWLLEEVATPVYCMKVDEYEHVCFLWARGLDKVVYPAILGLLHEYAEVWAEPESGEKSGTAVQQPKVRTVSWINEPQIRTLFEMGQGHLDASGSKFVLDGRVSAERILLASSRPVTRAGTALDMDAAAAKAASGLERLPGILQRIASGGSDVDTGVGRKMTDHGRPNGEEVALNDNETSDDAPEINRAVMQALVREQSQTNLKPLITESGKGGGRSGSSTGRDKRRSFSASQGSSHRRPSRTLSNESLESEHSTASTTKAHLRRRNNNNGNDFETAAKTGEMFQPPLTATSLDLPPTSPWSDASPLVSDASDDDLDEDIHVHFNHHLGNKGAGGIIGSGFDEDGLLISTGSSARGYASQHDDDTSATDTTEDDGNVTPTSARSGGRGVLTGAGTFGRNEADATNPTKASSYATGILTSYATAKNAPEKKQDMPSSKESHSSDELALRMRSKNYIPREDLFKPDDAPTAEELAIMNMSASGTIGRKQGKDVNAKSLLLRMK